MGFPRIIPGGLAKNELTGNVLKKAAGTLGKRRSAIEPEKRMAPVAPYALGEAVGERPQITT